MTASDGSLSGMSPEQAQDPPFPLFCVCVCFPFFVSHPPRSGSVGSPVYTFRVLSPPTLSACFACEQRKGSEEMVFKQGNFRVLNP